MTATGDIVTLREAAEHFKVHLSTIRYWLRQYPGYIRRYRKPLDKRIYVSLAEIEQLREELVPEEGDGEEGEESADN